MKIASLVGARPQFIKEAILNARIAETGAWNHVLINSGQHYDAGMASIFFDELHLPKPDFSLGVGSGSHAETTAQVMLGMEKILLAEKPDALLVYGDTNTTLGGALAAAKIHVPIIHVEAGIRMLPETMPEEINRRLTDRLSSLLFCCSDLGRQNLAAEGIRRGVETSGDIMLDLYRKMTPHFDEAGQLRKYSLTENSYIVATLHRDYNVDDPQKLSAILQGLEQIRRKLGKRILLPLHPRTRKRIADAGLEKALANFDITEPLGYMELQALTRKADFVITDSGGLQKEAYYSGKRSVVVMPDTGWRELTDSGWNLLAAPEPESLLAASEAISTPCEMPHNCYGDGRAADVIIEAIRQKFQ